MSFIASTRATCGNDDLVIGDAELASNGLARRRPVETRHRSVGNDLAPARTIAAAQMVFQPGGRNWRSPGQATATTACRLSALAVARRRSGRDRGPSSECSRQAGSAGAPTERARSAPRDRRDTSSLHDIGLSASDQPGNWSHARRNAARRRRRARQPQYPRAAAHPHESPDRRLTIVISSARRGPAVNIRASMLSAPPPTKRSVVT